MLLMWSHVIQLSEMTLLLIEQVIMYFRSHQTKLLLLYVLT